MADLDIGQITRTDMANIVTDYSVDTYQTDAAGDQKETTYINSNWSQQLGYYKKIPELSRAIQALATWTIGKGFTSDSTTEVILSTIRGWGEDTFLSIMKNLLVTKKIGGDAFAQIVRNPETNQLINIKPLDPAVIKVVVSDKGIIIRYEQISKVKGKKPHRFEPSEILHLCNERIADEIHGMSLIDVCEWVILARNEAMADKKRVHHRSTIRVMEVDTHDTAKLATIKSQYAEAIKAGELMIVPEGNVKFPDVPISYLDTKDWIKYLENFFYQALGIPKIILGGSEEFTEASSKIGYLTFEQIYAGEQRELEEDLWNQCAIKLEFVKPASLKGELLSDEKKDTGQMGVQPGEVTAGVGE